jgi:hypothetical protein
MSAASGRRLRASRAELWALLLSEQPQLHVAPLAQRLRALRGDARDVARGVSSR